MARIPEVDLERLKREIAVERLAQARGVELKQHGSDVGTMVPLVRFAADSWP